MANLDNRPGAYGASVDRSAVGVIDEGLRAFMLRVYNYMAIGLVLTGVAAYGAYSAAVSSVPTEYALRGGIYLTSFGAAIYTSPLMWLIVLAPLGLVFFLTFRINRLSVSAAQTTFWVYSALVGLSLSTIFLVYTMASITQVFFITAAMFGAMSLWGYTTKRVRVSWRLWPRSLTMPSRSCSSGKLRCTDVTTQRPENTTRGP